MVASSFMNPAESRASQNPNRVRIFGTDQLSKSVAGQKWDRAKVVCTQPFNKVGRSCCQQWLNYSTKGGGSLFTRETAT